MEALMAKRQLNDDEVANLTAFLLAVGFDKKDVEAVLKEKGVDNAGEIVEAFAPKRRKAYVPESCESLKAKGICVADCKVRNPLQYYFGSLT
jgi:DNA primase large subunit